MMRNRERVVYSSGKTPKWYVCADCDTSGVKLWRPHTTMQQKLLCFSCAAKDQFKTVSKINSDGKWVSDFGLTDQIGNFVPAIPQETKVGFWVYSSAPSEAQKWWRSLPAIIIPSRTVLEGKEKTDG